MATNVPLCAPSGDGGEAGTRHTRVARFALASPQPAHRTQRAKSFYTICGSRLYTDESKRTMHTPWALADNWTTRVAVGTLADRLNGRPSSAPFSNKSYDTAIFAH